MLDADPLINKTASSIDMSKRQWIVDGWRGICKISAELLKAGDETILCRLHAVLTDAWHRGTIIP